MGFFRPAPAFHDTGSYIANCCKQSVTHQFLWGKDPGNEWANPTGHSFYHWALRERVTGQVEVD